MLAGAVKSCEKNGYAIDFGITDVVGFLPSSSAVKYLLHGQSTLRKPSTGSPTKFVVYRLVESKYKLFQSDSYNEIGYVGSIATISRALIWLTMVLLFSSICTHAKRFFRNSLSFQININFRKVSCY